MNARTSPRARTPRTEITDQLVITASECEDGNGGAAWIIVKGEPTFLRASEVAATIRMLSAILEAGIR
jgi:hypothetical protein